MAINNTLSSSLYGAISAPQGVSSIYKKINPGLVATPMSLSSQVKAKATTAPAPAPTKPLVSLTGGANASSLLNNPLKLPGTAPSLTGQASQMSFIPKAEASTTQQVDPNLKTIQNQIAQIRAQVDARNAAQNNTGGNTETSTSSQPVQTYNPPTYTTGPTVPSSNPDQAPVKGLFPDILSSLVQNANKGRTQVALANEDLQNFNNAVAQKNTDIVGTGADLAFKTGQQQALQTQSAIGQETRQQSVANALSAQKQGIDALTSAAGFAQPQVASYGQTSFDPSTGQFAGGGSLPESVMQQYAGMAANGQYASIPASITSNPVLSAQLNEAAKKINPNFTPLNSSSLGSANADIISKATSDISNMQTNLQAADSNLSQLTSLAQQNGINDLTSVTANKIANLFKGEFSNQALYSFNALLGGTRALYAAVLESRANLAPTDAYTIANQQVPDNVNLGALQQLTSTLKAEAQNIVTAKQQQIQGAQTNTSSSSSTQNSSSSTTIGGTTFKLVNGKWQI